MFYLKILGYQFDYLLTISNLTLTLIFQPRVFQGQVIFFKWEPQYFMGRAENFTSKYGLDHNHKVIVKMLLQNDGKARITLPSDQ